MNLLGQEVHVAHLAATVLKIKYKPACPGNFAVDLVPKENKNNRETKTKAAIRHGNNTIMLISITKEDLCYSRSTPSSSTGNLESWVPS